ncbi:FUSC family protein [Pseudodesulfovibrio cashew]|uniref:FUSC family protein n=1 Tax=Pseudodesulfovibrio cashew TaxID=2678688 RepID=A0A6I6JHB2_9BACT|nr:FUSC family protein [Pseudodesulfovibrio cashew]QGY40408.1 FUSC family protein [Pseudodesulfovibrio cashew]
MSMVKRMIRSEHVRHGVKVGLASVLAYLLADWVGLPYGYWAVITTVIVMQMHVADSIRMCLYRFSGTAIGAVMGIAMILIFPPTHWFTVLGIFVGTAICAYLTRYDARFRMAAITVSIVYLTSLGTDSRIPFGLFRVAEIGVGVLCAFVVSVLVWPNRAGSTLRARLKGQFEDAAARYALLMSNFLSLQKKADPDLFFDLDADIRKNTEMFHSVYATERLFFREDVALLSMQVTVIRSVLERLQSMLTLLNEVEGTGFDIIMAPELNELVRTTSEALCAVGAGEPHDPRALAAAVVAIEARFHELRQQGVTLRFGVRRLFQVLGFINAAQHLGEYMLEILNRKEMTAGE